MTYNSSTQTTGLDKAIAGVLVAGVMFVLGYTVIRASLAAKSTQSAVASDSDVTVVVPGEGTLWAEFSNSY